MRNKKTSIIGLCVIILLMILTFYLLLRDNEITEIVSIIKGIDIKYFILGLLMLFVYLFMGAYYLRMLLKSLGSNVKMNRTFFYMCCDFYFSAITPSSTGGQPAQIFYMTKDGIPALTSTMVIVLVTAIYKIPVIILGILFVLFKPSFILSHGLFFNIMYIVGLIINIAFCVFCICLMFSPDLIEKIVIWFVDLFEKLKIVKNKKNILDKFYCMLDDYKRGADYLKKNRMIIFKAIIYCFIQRIALFTIPYFVYKSFGLSGVNILEFILVQTGITIAIDNLPLPGGICATEMLFLRLYGDVFNGSILMPALLLTRGINYYLCLVLTGIVVLVNHVRIVKKNNLNNKKSV